MKIIIALAVAASVAAQESASVQKLLERGALDEAVERASREQGNPESTYLAAQAFAKMNNNDRAGEEYTRLRENGDESWKAIGESGVLLTEGNVAGAMESAERAVASQGENPFAHYQVGVVANRQSNFQKAAEAFRRSVELKPDLAYGHYYAGIAAQRLKQTGRMSEHFSMFLQLAPEAPEYAAVASTMRTLRPRS